MPALETFCNTSKPSRLLELKVGLQLSHLLNLFKHPHSQFPKTFLKEERKPGTVTWALYQYHTSVQVRSHSPLQCCLHHSQSFSLIWWFSSHIWIARKALYSIPASPGSKRTRNSLTFYLRPPRRSTKGTTQEQPQVNRHFLGFPLGCEGFEGCLEQVKAFCVFNYHCHPYLSLAPELTVTAQLPISLGPAHSYLLTLVAPWERWVTPDASASCSDCSRTIILWAVLVLFQPLHNSRATVLPEARIYISVFKRRPDKN